MEAAALRDLCLDPMSSDGIPRKGASLTPADEFPTIADEFFINSFHFIFKVFKKS